MIEYALPSIENSEDYITAMTPFRPGQPMTAEEADKLLDVYEKYVLKVEDREFAKLYAAVDLLPGRTEADADVFAPLALGEENLTALFLTREIIFGKAPDGEEAGKLVEMVQGGALSEPVRVLLARAALNSMVAARNFVELQPQIRALAGFLVNCGAELLGRYTILIKEIKLKCQS